MRRPDHGFAPARIHRVGNLCAHLLRGRFVVVEVSATVSAAQQVEMGFDILRAFIHRPATRSSSASSRGIAGACPAAAAAATTALLQPERPPRFSRPRVPRAARERFVPGFAVLAMLAPRPRHPKAGPRGLADHRALLRRSRHEGNPPQDPAPIRNSSRDRIVLIMNSRTSKARRAPPAGSRSSSQAKTRPTAEHHPRKGSLSRQARTRCARPKAAQRRRSPVQVRGSIAQQGWPACRVMARSSVGDSGRHCGRRRFHPFGLLRLCSCRSARSAMCVQASPHAGSGRARWPQCGLRLRLHRLRLGTEEFSLIAHARFSLSFVRLTALVLPRRSCSSS